MSTTMSQRPSGVDGLVIWGRAGVGYSLHYDAGDRLLSVSERRLGMYGRSANSFPLARDAKAAAQRMADLLPWASPDVPQIIKDASPEDRMALDRAIFEALIGMTVEQFELAERERHEAERRLYSGEFSRDRADEQARELGHEYINWRRSGQRSWRGRCRSCKAEIRVSYRSVSGRHEIQIPECAA